MKYKVKKMKRFILFFVLLGHAVVSPAIFMWGPNGAVNVTETGNGYVISDLTGNGNTSIIKTSDGYVIVPPDEPASFIYMDEEERRENPDVFPIGPSLLDDEWE